MQRQLSDNRSTIITTNASLRVCNGSEAGRLITIEAFPCLIGRGGNSHVLLCDPDPMPSLSREHATISLQGNEVLLTDHSLNGTRVGTRKLNHHETTLLHLEEEIVLGSTLRVKWQKPISLDMVKPSPNKPAHATFRPNTLKGQLVAYETLHSAWKRVALNRGAAGVDHVTLSEYASKLERHLAVLQDALQRGKYEPAPVRLFAAPKRSGGVRTIAILTIQDRIVQQALHTVLQPLMEPLFPSCSFAYRPERSSQDALRRVDALIREGNHWIAETDVASFFDKVSHRILLEKLGSVVPDAFILSLVTRFLAVGATAPGIGIPQGAATSPLFSNLYLAEFDGQMIEGDWNPVRYGDDMVFLCESRNRAQHALSTAEGFLRGRLHLSLKAEKTTVVPLKQGFTYLGFHFNEAGRTPAPEAIAQLDAKLREAEPTQVAAVIRGWTNYFGVTPTLQNESEDVTMNPLFAPNSDWIAQFRTLFGGRAETYARQQANGKHSCFVACEGQPTDEDIRAHIQGRETLASYLLREDGRITMLVMDMDAIRNVRRPSEKTPAYDLEPVHAFTKVLYRECRRFGLPVCLEESGMKGWHLWLFFSETVEPEKARRLARLLALRAGFPCEGVRLEIFPRQTEWPGPELGDAVKLPFGVHPVSGRRCLFVEESGEVVTDLNAALKDIPPISLATVDAVLRALVRAGKASEMVLEQEMKPANSPVEKLVQGCSVVRALVDRAQKVGHLRHTHQLILLYTAGHLGEAGAKFLHKTIAHCRNYDPNICQGYIDRLEANHPPVSCRRIREWLEEEGETGLCTCAGSRRTPLELIPLEPKAKQRKSCFPHLKEIDIEIERQWQEVAQDLFDEEKI